MDVNQSVAIVTGAAGGIGEAVAQRLLERGAQVVITDLDQARVDAAVQRLETVSPGNVRGAEGDASAEADIAAAITLAQDAFGPVDLYVANAGIGDGEGLEASEEQWSLALDVNLMAHVRAARALVPGWVERGHGYFVSTASAAGLLTQIGSATFAEWLSVTYGAQGVGVSCLCPMGVDTDMLRSGMTSREDDGQKAVAAVTGAGDVLEPLTVADDVLAAIAEETFLILPHADVREFLRRKVDDHDRWIRGMQRYQSSLS